MKISSGSVTLLTFTTFILEFKQNLFIFIRINEIYYSVFEPPILIRNGGPIRYRAKARRMADAEDRGQKSPIEKEKEKLGQ